MFLNIIVSIGCVVIFHSYKPTGARTRFIALPATLAGKKEKLKRFKKQTCTCKGDVAMTNNGRATD